MRKAQLDSVERRVAKAATTASSQSTVPTGTDILVRVKKKPPSRRRQQLETTIPERMAEMGLVANTDDSR